MRLVGVELYVQDVPRAARWYQDALGLDLLDEEADRYARFATGQGFVCLEANGSEAYPSQDRAVVFLEVDDLATALDAAGRERVVASGAGADGAHPAWAVLHDPDGHNVLLLQASGAGGPAPCAG